MFRKNKTTQTITHQTPDPVHLFSKHLITAILLAFVRQSVRYCKGKTHRQIPLTGETKSKNDNMVGRVSMEPKNQRTGSQFKLRRLLGKQLA